MTNSLLYFAVFEHGLFFMNVSPESEISQWIQGIQTHFDIPVYLEGLINKQCMYIYIHAWYIHGIDMWDDVGLSQPTWDNT